MRMNVAKNGNECCRRLGIGDNMDCRTDRGGLWLPAVPTGYWQQLCLGYAQTGVRIYSYIHSNSSEPSGASSFRCASDSDRS